jgi:hypothetical protein
MQSSANRTRAASEAPSGLVGPVAAGTISGLRPGIRAVRFLLEALDGLARTASKLGQALGADDQNDDEQNDEQFKNAEDAGSPFSDRLPGRSGSV